jgi:hypothetical protein
MLAGCVPLFGPPPGDLRSARQACNAEYPERIGNYLPHARCVNAAIETYAMPTAQHPDLVHLQAEVRERLSERIDRGIITPRTGERQMHEADAHVADAERDRDAGRLKAARHHVDVLEAMLR